MKGEWKILVTLCLGKKLSEKHQITVVNGYSKDASNTTTNCFQRLFTSWKGMFL